MSRIKEIVRTVSEDLYGKGQLELVDRYYAEDYVNHAPPEGFDAGREGLRAFVSTIHESLSDVNAETTHVLADGDLAAVRWEVSFVHAGEFLGVPPTNETVSIDGICIYRLENGRIVEEWPRQDTLGLLQQLDAVPEMA